ncbi:MAG: exodeoxyribonuclease III [Burkholderiales bacterium]|nr:exodeoxyribonuclease III [Burkholderiales bacterium]
MARRKRLALATYNINGIGSRLPNLIAWLREAQPDIVCLQELKATQAAFPKEQLQAEGYHAAWVGQKAWNGVAILSRGSEPLVVATRLPGEPDDDQARYLQAAVKGLVVCCLYAPNGNPITGPKYAYKLRWMRRLIAHVGPLAAGEFPVVLAGDFNVVPTDFDIYNPKSWRRDALLQPEVREVFAELLAQGWTDSLRALNPDEQLFTFWDYFRQHWQRNAGLRIDHILVNGVVAPWLKRAGVDMAARGEAHASDHAPTWVELMVPPPAA